MVIMLDGVERGRRQASRFIGDRRWQRLAIVSGGYLIGCGFRVDMVCADLLGIVSNCVQQFLAGILRVRVRRQVYFTTFWVFYFVLYLRFQFFERCGVGLAWWRCFLRAVGGFFVGSFGGRTLGLGGSRGRAIFLVLIRVVLERRQG